MEPPYESAKESTPITEFFSGALKRTKLTDTTEDATQDPVSVKMMEDLHADTFFFKN